MGEGNIFSLYVSPRWRGTPSLAGGVGGVPIQVRREGVPRQDQDPVTRHSNRGVLVTRRAVCLLRSRRRLSCFFWRPFGYIGQATTTENGSVAAKYKCDDNSIGSNIYRGGGRQPIIWPIFPENYMKMKTFWARKWGASLLPPPRILH